MRWTCHLGSKQDVLADDRMHWRPEYCVGGWQGVSGREGRKVMEQPALWTDMSDYSEV